MLKRIDAKAKIIPRHGPLATRAALKAIHSALIETIAIVEKRRVAGQSLKAAGLPERYAKFGTGFIKAGMWIQIVYKSLKAARIALNPATWPSVPGRWPACRPVCRR